MSIFAKPISQISSQDLQELLDEKAVENVRLEFKREIPTKDETLKKLSSFANAFGGFVIVGAEANSSDGRIVAIPGVEAQGSYKQTVVQWCFGAVYPPLVVEVSDPIPSPAGTGKVCYVLYTAESDVAPHFLNGRKGVYVRTDEFSARFEPRFATDTELRYLFDRRKLILQRRVELLDRARQRFRTLVERKHKGPDGGGLSIGPHLELFVSPRFPVQALCDQGCLRSLLERKGLSWCQVRFPRVSGGAIFQHESVIVPNPVTSFSMLEGTVWGALFYATAIGETQSGHSGIHLSRFVGHILVFIRHAALILTEVGYAGPLLIQLTLKSIFGVTWLWHPYGVPEIGPASELDDEVSFFVNTTREELAENSDKVSMDLLRYTFFATNWPTVADSPQRLEAVLALGHKFNLWS